MIRSNANGAFASAFLCICISAAAVGDDKEPDLPLEGKTERLAFSTSEGSWMSLDVAPDGADFVFDLLGDLYRLPLTGGHAVRITSGLGYDSQPQISPDGEWIAFISDRSGADNLWVARRDGSGARMLSDEKQFGLISPNWLPDSKRIVVTKTAVKPEFTMYHLDGGSGVTLSGPDAETKFWGIGAEVSPDGRYLYFAQKVDSNGPVKNFPAAQVSRYDFIDGNVDQLTRGEGGGMRPVLSPDGQLLVYATRDNTRTGLRVRNLATGDDRWLTYPVQRDAQENSEFRPPSRDLLPGYSFTPDGKSVVFNADGGFYRVAVATGQRTAIEFTADVELDVGPDLTFAYRVPEGPLTATLVHDPQPSPDGSTIVTSVLSKLYVVGRDGGEPRRLTDGDAWEFKPVWSPDGRWIAYVTWSMDNGGHIWRTRANGRGRPQRLSEFSAFYTDLVYSPDGESLYAMRGNEYMRHQTFSEFGGLGIPLELVSLPADGGAQTTITAARKARNPHFAADPERIFLYDDKGLFSVQLDGADRRAELAVTGPMGNRRSEEPLQAEMVTISPSGEYALALVNKQVWIVSTAKTGAVAPTVAVGKPSLPAVRLTDIGADFFGWNRAGDTVHWAIGNTWYERPLADIEFYKEEEEPSDEDENASEESEDPFVPADRHESVRALQIDVVVPRNTPSGSILLTGGNIVTMRGASTDAMASVLTNHDVLITDNRIAAIGPAGTLTVEDGTTVVDSRGKTVVPGFIDTHAHWEFRIGDVLEPHNWTLIANLAYGVTAGLDVQTAYKDYLAYRDFQQTGQSIGQRAFMTARGVFGNNDFQSYDATLAYLRRYSDHYHTKNIKSYVVGNRQQRQWVVLAAKELGLMPTTEGGADQKLDITHAIDGMHGNEHNLPDSPIFNDVVHLFAQTRTAYTPTLIVQYNAGEMREYFFTRTDVSGNRKLRRFYPANRLDELTERRPGWQRDDEFAFTDGAAAAAKIQRAGGLVGVGGHAELQGLGYHWEMWAYAMGGMTPIEVLRAATIDAAHIIGIAEDLGSIEVGKLADLVVLNASPLDDIRNTTAIHQVMQNGRLYDGDTLDQIWPEARPLPPFWWWSEDDPRYEPSANDN